MVHHKEVSIKFKIEHLKVILQRKHCHGHFIVFLLTEKKESLKNAIYKKINKLTD